MTNKAILPLLIVATALPQAGVLAAEPLPPRALVRIGDHRFYHGPGITCAVLSPDGRRIASATAHDPTIVLWDAATGDRLHELRIPHGASSSLAFSPNGKWLAAGYTISDEKFGVVLFDVETGKHLWQLGDFERKVEHIQFTADGKQLCVSEAGGPVSAWDSATGKRIRLWKPPPRVPPRKEMGEVLAALGVLSPDGEVIAWEMCYSINGNFPGVANRLRVLNASTDQMLYEKDFKKVLRLTSFSFSSDSKRFTAHTDLGLLAVWETSSGKELAALEVPESLQFALTADGRRVLIREGFDRPRLWDLKTGKPSRYLGPSFVASKYTAQKRPLPFSTDGKTLLLAADSTLRLFDVKTGEEHAVPGHRAPVTPRFSADGRTLFTSCDEKRCSWDVSSASKPALLTDERRNAWEAGYVACSADDRLFLDRSSEDCFRVRETATGRFLKTLPDPARFAYFSPDASRLLLSHEVSGRPDEFRLYDTKTGSVLGEIKQRGERWGGPVFSPNGQLLAWSDRTGVVHLHDAKTGRKVKMLQPPLPLPLGKKIVPNLKMLFSPDGARLIVTGYLSSLEFERRIRLPLHIFQISSGREIGQFYANPKKLSEAGGLSCMAWSPDGLLLALAERESGTIRLLEIVSGKVRAEFAGHRHGVHGLAFSPDGRTLASGGEDNVVFLWDVTGARTPAGTEKPLAAWWTDLASEDAKCAGDAIAGLLRKPEASVAFLKERLRPAEMPDEKRLARLLAQLDSNIFETRAAANRELARLGDPAEAALRRALNDRLSLEARRRIENLLDKLERGTLPPETLRTIEVLEHLGTAEARSCLDVLAKGAPQARLTGEAKRALDRLANRR